MVYRRFIFSFRRGFVHQYLFTMGTFSDIFIELVIQIYFEEKGCKLMNKLGDQINVILATTVHNFRKSIRLRLDLFIVSVFGVLINGIILSCVNLGDFFHCSIVFKHHLIILTVLSAGSYQNRFKT